MSDKKQTFYYMLSRLISLLGDSLHQVAMVWYTYNLHDDSTSIVFVITCSCVPKIFLAPLSGILVDYFPHRKVMIYADLIRMIIVLAIPILMVLFRLKSIIFLCSMAFALSMVGLVFRPSEKGIINELVDRNQLIKINGFLESINQATRFIGPVLAGLLLTFVSVSLLFYLDALSFLVSAVLLLLFVKVGNHSLGHHSKLNITRSFFKEQLRAFTVIFKNKLLLVLVLTMMASNLTSVGIHMIVFPLLSVKTFYLGPQGFGILEGSLGLGMLITSLAINRILKKVVEINLIIAGLAIVATAYLVMSLSSIFTLTMFCCFLVGLGTIPLLLVSISMLQLASTRKNIGRVFSTLGMMYALSVSTSLFIVNLIVKSFGVSTVLLLSSIFTFVTVIVFSIVAKQWRFSHLITQIKK